MRERAFRNTALMRGGMLMGGVGEASLLGTRMARNKQEQLAEQAARKIEMAKPKSTKLGGGHFSPYTNRNTLLGG